jgi:hypothetical protein
MKNDTCGCCKTPQLVPLKIINRPGLSAISFRTGTFSNFRNELLNALSGTPELSKLKTRVSTDYSITFVELWAIVADVLTFYQERIANEGFIRTARERDSIVRLSRLIDYRLGPGSAATTLLAFMAEEGKTVIIPERLKVQSVPGQDEQPQKYETLESLVADSRFNSLQIYPRPIDTALKEKKELYLSPNSTGLEIAGSLSPGSQIIFFDQEKLEELKVDRVRPYGEQMLLFLTTPIQHNWNEIPDAFRFTRKMRLFGVNAPAQYVKPMLPDLDSHIIFFTAGNGSPISGYDGILQSVLSALEQYPKLTITIEGHADTINDETYDLQLSDRRASSVADLFIYYGISAERLDIQAYGSSKPIFSPCDDQNNRVEIKPVPLSAEEFEWKLQLTDYNRSPDHDNVLELDTVYEDLIPGTKLLISVKRDSGYSVIQRTILQTSSANVTRGPLNSIATVVMLDDDILPGETFDISDVTIYELAGPKINFWKYEYPDNISEAIVCIPGKKIDDERIEIGRTIEKFEYQEGIEVGLDDLEIGRKVILSDKDGKTVTATISDVLIMDHNAASTLSYADNCPAIKFNITGSPLLWNLPEQAENSQDFLVLFLDTNSGLDLDRYSALLFGNVARASHGETVKNEIMGDGDASSEFQEYLLKNNPVTFLPAPVSGGIKSSLSVFVSNVRWKEVTSLYGKEAKEEVYTTRIENDGAMSVQFGDGITGARLITGRRNITAYYRQGLGLQGRVGKGVIKTLLDRPVGLQSVTNPLPTDGGADPETRDHARKNAPTKVRTFKRAISLRDFEDLATSSGIVAKAKATRVWSGKQQVVHLTIADQEGAEFSQEGLSDVYKSLSAQRDPNHILIVQNFTRVPIVIGASLRVDMRYISDEVEKSAVETLIKALSFEELEFGQTVHLSDVYRILQEVEGVESVDIKHFHFKYQLSVNLMARGACSKTVQPYLSIFAARPGSDISQPPLAAEQAWIEHPDRDVVISSSGGLQV